MLRILRHNFSTAATDIPKYRVVVLGGGTAGMAVASMLNNNHFDKYTKKLVTETPEGPELHYSSPMAVCEPSDYHYYQPLWTLVGAGLKTFEQSRRLESQVAEDHVQKGHMHLIKRKALRVHPDSNVVELDGGLKISYDYLVVATGLECKWNAIPGLEETLGNDKFMVTSNYSADSVQKTAEYIKKFKGGVALFTQPSTPVKCAGAPQKIMYLAEEQWRLNMLRHPQDIKAHVIFKQGMGKIFAVEKYAKSLAEVCSKRNIEVDLGHELRAILPETKEAVFVKHLPESIKGEEYKVKFDFMHVTPPMAPPEYISQSGLANAGGWCNVDAKTLQHQKYRNIFSIGDSSSVPVSKTATAAAAQSGPMVANLLSQIEADVEAAEFTPGQAQLKAFSEYDGYTACPLVTGRGKLIMAEFNGFTLQPQETFWFDQAKESSLMYAVKADILPTIYWDFMLKGNWQGPKQFRRYFNPMNKN